MIDVLGREHGQAEFGGQAGHGREKAVLARLVSVGEHGLDVVTRFHQSPQAGAAYVVIGKNNCFHKMFPLVPLMGVLPTTRWMK